jgi:glycosyltransferase involved in cell wall biosynthesis
MKFLVAGTCRNISPFWQSVQLSLQKIFQVLDSYDMIIVESNSDDNTLELLRTWSQEKENIKVISMGNLEGSRTQRISRCRNEYLKYITDHDYLLVVDLDDILNIQDNFQEQLSSCFSRNDWDCIASNRLEKYYDIWALRSLELGCNFDCWEMANKYGITKLTSRGFQKIPDRKNYVDKFMINIPQQSEWISCESAFGGMALYKTSAIKSKKYNGDKTCEHVEFNKGLRIFINPFFLSG